MSTNKLSHLKQGEKIYLEVEKVTLSGKEVTVTIDGKEYTAVMK